MKLTQMAFGLATFVPGVYGLVSRGEQDSRSAAYCYSVWLRHLRKAGQAGLSSPTRHVVELGPGGSLGVCLAALLCGAEFCSAYDVTAHAEIERSLQLLDELASMFSRREPIPHAGACAAIKPALEDYSFPHEMLPEQRLEASLAPQRLERIRQSLRQGDEAFLRYVTGPDMAALAPPKNAPPVDFLLSQAVLEYVPDIDEACARMRRLLPKGALVSHQIDLRCHNTHQLWNGHWTYDDLAWRILRGGRPYALNREPCSRHLQALEAAGFEILRVAKLRKESRLTKGQLARRFHDLSEEDLCTSSLFVQARAI